MTAPTPESPSAVYRRCAAAVERAIAAIQANPSLYRNRAARNKLVELAAAAKQLDRQLDGNESDDDDHFGEAFAAAALDMRPADVDTLAACAAAAADDAEPCAAATPVTAAGDVEPTAAALASRPLDADAKKKIKKKSKKQRVREKKRAARAAAEEAELPPCREIATPPEVLAALEASDRVDARAYRARGPVAVQALRTHRACGALAVQAWRCVVLGPRLPRARYSREDGVTGPRDEGRGASAGLARPLRVHRVDHRRR